MNNIQIDEKYEDPIYAKYEELLFIARMNIKMHQDRESFYLSFTRGTSALSIILSSAAIAAIGTVLPESFFLTREQLIAVLTILVTVFNAIQLAFGFPNKVQAHATFRRKWLEVESQLKTLSLSSHDVSQLLMEIEKKAYQLHGDEPPVSEAHKRIAYNYAVESLGYEKTYKIPIFFS
jgi:hypothetical protein